MSPPEAGDNPERLLAKCGQSSSLGELARLFFRLGATSFGDPAAHIALLEQVVIDRRGWLTPEQFLDLLGLIPASGLGRRASPGPPEL